MTLSDGPDNPDSHTILQWTECVLFHYQTDRQSLRGNVGGGSCRLKLNRSLKWKSDVISRNGPLPGVTIHPVKHIFSCWVLMDGLSVLIRVKRSFQTPFVWPTMSVWGPCSEAAGRRFDVGLCFCKGCRSTSRSLFLFDFVCLCHFCSSHLTVTLCSTNTPPTATSWLVPDSQVRYKTKQ